MKKLLIILLLAFTAPAHADQLLGRAINVDCTTTGKDIAIPLTVETGNFVVTSAVAVMKSNIAMSPGAMVGLYSGANGTGEVLSTGIELPWGGGVSGAQSVEDLIHPYTPPNSNGYAGYFGGPTSFMLYLHIQQGVTPCLVDIYVRGFPAHG